MTAPVTPAGHVDSAATTDMVAALILLRAALDGVALPLDVPGAEEHRVMRREMVDQLEDYVLPRLIQIEAPLLTVVGGSTGAGKSTLVNSLVGRRVTEPGVLRPTTRSPVLVHNPADDRQQRGLDLDQPGQDVVLELVDHLLAGHALLLDARGVQGERRGLERPPQPHQRGHHLGAVAGGPTGGRGARGVHRVGTTCPGKAIEGRTAPIRAT